MYSRMSRVIEIRTFILISWADRKQVHQSKQFFTNFYLEENKKSFYSLNDLINERNCVPLEKRKFEWMEKFDEEIE